MQIKATLDYSKKNIVGLGQVSILLNNLDNCTRI